MTCAWSPRHSLHAVLQPPTGSHWRAGFWIAHEVPSPREKNRVKMQVPLYHQNQERDWAKFKISLHRLKMVENPKIIYDEDFVIKIFLTHTVFSLSKLALFKKKIFTAVSCADSLSILYCCLAHGAVLMPFIFYFYIKIHLAIFECFIYVEGKYWMSFCEKNEWIMQNQEFCCIRPSFSMFLWLASEIKCWVWWLSETERCKQKKFWNA